MWLPQTSGSWPSGSWAGGDPSLKFRAGTVPTSDSRQAELQVTDCFAEGFAPGFLERQVLPGQWVLNLNGSRKLRWLGPTRVV